MSSTAAVAAHGAHAEHHALGFWRTYVFSEDHKMIARQFLFMALFMMSVGGLMAMLMRLDLAWPDTQWKILGYFPSFLQSDSAITPNIYNSMLTMHATIMIFFVVMPILVGCFGNFLIPLMIGARDMAFPKLNMLSFWVGAVAGVIMLSSFFVTGGPAAAGWTSYAPLSAVPIYTGV
ncbi:MAG: cbb3-type cytochrome c oxidase subunit I, partial [Candidatus Binatus sp.]